MTGLPLLHSTVRPEWIDYNGHLSEAFYVLVFGHATDALMTGTGLDSGYRESTRCSLYTVESHIRFLRDVSEGAHLAVRTRVLGAAARKARFQHEMYVVPGPEAEPRPTRPRSRRPSCSRSTSTSRRGGPPSSPSRSGAASRS